MDIINFLPGPVAIPANVEEAFKNRYISHRTEAFSSIYNNTKSLLKTLLNVKHVQLLMGSGTLANEVIAGQLSVLNSKGLIITNGEFSERLAKQAHKWGLNFKKLELAWGKTFTISTIENYLKQGNIEWLWTTYCETSTGVLNPKDTLSKICNKYNVKLCLDAISAVGTIPLDLNDVYLASAVSSKGLMSYAGIAIVMHNHAIRESDSLPSYLDLGVYAEKQHTPFTFSSNLLYALHCSLSNNFTNEHFTKIKHLNSLLINELQKMHLSILVGEPNASPAVITIELPKEISSKEFAKKLWEQGIWLSYESEYLLKRNHVQICLMGEHSEANINRLLSTLKKNLHLFAKAEFINY